LPDAHRSTRPITVTKELCVEISQIVLNVMGVLKDAELFQLSTK
jgi:hypothetical protein